MKDISVKVLKNWKMLLKINDYQIELFCPIGYTKVNPISIDCDGHFEIDTNLGYENYDIKDMLKLENRSNEWHLLKQEIIKYLNKKIKSEKNDNSKENAKSKKVETCNTILETRGFVISIYKNSKHKNRNDEKELYVLDKKYKYFAILSIKNVDNDVIQISTIKTTFPDSKRKYEMLYIVEKNKEELLEAFDR